MEKKIFFKEFHNFFKYFSLILTKNIWAKILILLLDEKKVIVKKFHKV